MSSKKHLSTEYYSLGFQHKLNYTFEKTLSLYPATMEIPGSTEYRLHCAITVYSIPSTPAVSVFIIRGWVSAGQAPQPPGTPDQLDTTSMLPHSVCHGELMQLVLA